MWPGGMCGGACMAGDIRGGGVCVAGGHAWWGACMTGGPGGMHGGGCA